MIRCKISQLEKTVAFETILTSFHFLQIESTTTMY